MDNGNNMGEVCVIIGAASGIGESCARRFIDRDNLLLADINATRLDEFAKELSWEGARVETAVCDVNNKASIASLVTKASSLGQLKVLVDSAGISPGMTNDWKRIMSVNLVGMALVLEAFLPLADVGTTIVCIASIAGYQFPAMPKADDILDAPLVTDFMERIEPFVEELGRPMGMPNVASYNLSKRGVHRLVKNQAPLWHSRGARIVSVSPGLISSPMGLHEMDVNTKFMKPMQDMTVNKRMGAPEEIAGPVHFMCSTDASFISGIDIIIDGGYLAERASKVKKHSTTY